MGRLQTSVKRLRVIGSEAVWLHCRALIETRDTLVLHAFWGP